MPSKKKPAYRYGGTIGTGESSGGTSSNGTENKHVFKDGGVPCKFAKIVKILKKKK